MVHLLDLPYEVLNLIFMHCEPSLLVQFSRCSKALERILLDNPLLYREMYLSKYHGASTDNQEDNVARDVRSGQWQRDLLQYEKFEEVLASDDAALKGEQIEFVADCVQSLTRNASPANDEKSRNLFKLRQLFNNPENLRIFMCGSSLFARARGEAPDLDSITKRQLHSAKLHCLYGAPIEDSKVSGSGEDIYPYAVSRVYDLRNYTDKTMWGPFSKDGSETVDWEMMESIMIVLNHNLRLCRIFQNIFIQPLWSRPFAGMAPDSLVLYPPAEYMSIPSGSTFPSSPSPEHRHPAAPAIRPNTAHISLNTNDNANDNKSSGKNQKPEKESPQLSDPYGITGTWMRAVCFLDYSELYTYNFGFVPEDTPLLDPSEPRWPLNTDEAIRMIVMHVKVTGREAAGPGDAPGTPVVHFAGVSRPRYAYWDANATANVKGTVRTTREGEVRWTTFSVYHGETRDYDPQGPVGPTAFWKISNSPDSKMGRPDDDNDDDDDGGIH
ncbi:MAG: hypothetical protein LQ340_006442 [Diploschistes diacapsis]|nr:MAG: hypothetical protein LQ340_006442 [Diploschistes diacapsis]